MYAVCVIVGGAWAVMLPVCIFKATTLRSVQPIILCAHICSKGYSDHFVSS